MDLIFDFFEVLFNIYVFACVVFTTLFLWVIVPNVKQLQRDIQRELNGNTEESKTVEPECRFVKIESHGTLQYMFDAVTDKFICQAATEEELWETAQRLNSEYKLVLLTEEIIMSGDDEIKITFAPGCFDDFDGSQEELDDLISTIKEMAESGELFENSIQLDPNDLSDEDRELFDAVSVKNIGKKLH